MFRNERGTVLPVTLMIVLLLTTLAVAVTSLGMSEPQIAHNLSDSARARAVAEAGLEAAYLQVVNAATFTALISSAPSGGEVALATNATLPGLTAAHGTYSVLVRNDYRNGDNLITGVAKEASATADTNNRLILVATGTAGNATRTVQVMVKRTSLPPSPAALSFPGNDANTYFSADDFEVNGNDTNVNGTAGSCAAVYGISTVGTSNETVVQNSLSSAQKNNVKGKKQVTSGQAYGDNVIAPDATLTSAVVAAFVKDAKLAADVSLYSPSPSGLAYSSIGSSCSSNWASQTCWGTSDKPKIVYIKGDPDPTSAFSALNLSGTVTGHGILIIEDGDLKVTGNFTWHGLVIVTGQWVGLGLMGSTSGTDQTVYGAVISNETSTDPLYEGVVYADAKIRYSCEGLNRAKSSRRLVTMSSWQEVGQ
jgi:Tfp pilus assembly protein PilX